MSPDKVGYLTPDNIALQVWNANWVIADSDAEAHVLVVKVTDTRATIMWIEQGALATYEETCPDCEVTVIETNTGQLDKLPRAWPRLDGVAAARGKSVSRRP